MKALFFFPLALVAVASADVPQKAALTRYIQLWSESPFTRKPPPEQIVETTPLDDYALGGVSPVDGGYFVILLNRKKPDEKVIIQPGQTSDFRVLEVRPGDTGPLSTSVLVGAGSKSKLLSFDEKLLTLKTAPTGGKPPIAGQTGTPAGQPPGQPQPIAPPQQQAGGRPNPNGQSGTQGSGARPPRPRVIPPTR